MCVTVNWTIKLLRALPSGSAVLVINVADSLVSETFSVSETFIVEAASSPVSEFKSCVKVEVAVLGFPS